MSPTPSKHSNASPTSSLTDYRLRGRIQGTDLVGAINDILEKPCPALVMTAETAPEVIDSIKAQGFPLLIKPVSPPAFAFSCIISCSNPISSRNSLNSWRSPHHDRQHGAVDRLIGQ